MSGACRPTRLRLRVIHKHLPLIHVPSRTIAQGIATSLVPRLETEAGTKHLQPTGRATGRTGHVLGFAGLSFMDHTPGLFPLCWDCSTSRPAVGSSSRGSSALLVGLQTPIPSTSGFTFLLSSKQNETGNRTGVQGSILRIPNPAAP